MGLSKERKVFVGLLAVAGSALLLDMGFLRPSEAGASLPTGAVPASAGEQGDPNAVTTRVTKALGLDAIAERLRAGGGGEGLAIGDAFAFKDEWLGGAGLEPVSDAGAATVADQSQLPVLSAVMPTSSGGVAVINGRPYRVGSLVEGTGYRVREVQGMGAVLADGDRTLTLTIPKPDIR